MRYLLRNIVIILLQTEMITMYRKKSDSKKTTAATVSLLAVVFVLVVFTVRVYKNKRSTGDDAGRHIPAAVVSDVAAVTGSDIASVPQDEVSSDAAVSSETEPTAESAPESAAEVSSVNTETSAENDILNPDNKSEFYMVVYTGNQMIVVYQKDESGKYTHKFHFMKCSTGDLNASPTKEGVYTITEKEKWSKISDKEFAQYGCLISQDSNYYICSVSYSKKKAWMMIDGCYENLGKASTGGSIQLCVRDANWIYKNMPKGTQVNVVNRNGPDIKVKALPKRSKKNGGWDPTDKWSAGNPYFASATTTTTAAAADDTAATVAGE